MLHQHLEARLIPVHECDTILSHRSFVVEYSISTVSLPAFHSFHLSHLFLPFTIIVNYPPSSSTGSIAIILLSFNALDMRY